MATSQLTIIAICQIIMTAAGFIAVIAFVYAIFAFKALISRKINEVMGKVQPVVDQAMSIAEQAKETAEKVSDRVDSIMTKAEDTADKVTDKVQSVSDKVEEAVNPQIVTIAGIVGTAARCVQIYKDIMDVRKQSGPAYQGSKGGSKEQENPPCG